MFRKRPSEPDTPERFAARVESVSRHLHGLACELFLRRSRLVDAAPPERRADVLLSVGVIASGPGEGTTLNACALAVALQRTFQAPTLLVEANLRAPSLGRVLGLTEGPGLAAALAGTAGFAEVLRRPNDWRPATLPAGPADAADPAWLLQPARLRGLIEASRRPFDFLVFDCPPFPDAHEAALVAQVLDVPLLLADPARADGDRLLALRSALVAAGHPPAGTILNRAGGRRRRFWPGQG